MMTNYNIISTRKHYIQIIPEEWMDGHKCHHGDTLLHRDVVGCHREA